MALNCGIVGLPNVGKSTIFNAITRAGAQSANYPFCTIEPNIGRVDVPDDRLDRLEAMVKPKRTVPASMEFVDIAGLVEGASKGEGLGNKFLSHVRETNAIAQVIRCFDDSDVIHVRGKVDPVDDIKIINMELILSDMDSLDKQLQKLEKKVKSGDKASKSLYDVGVKLQKHLEQEKSARTLSLTSDEKMLAKQFFLVTMKPVLYVVNVDESSAQNGNNYTKSVEEYAAGEGVPVIRLCGKIEEELASLSASEQKEYLEGMGLQEPGLNRMIRASYTLLDLITFFTAGEEEVRAWTTRRGAYAPEAAGEIHSDIERGFIRAEVTSYDDAVAHSSLSGAKDAGKMRLEGKEYEIQDGDIVYFRFNV